MNEDVFKGYGVEVTLTDPDDFLILRETLTRIGIPSSTEKKLTQSCHLLHKRGRYAIMHFKEMFGIDGKKTTIEPDDLLRRNTVAHLLEDWGLCRVNEPEKVEQRLELSKIKIVQFDEKKKWELAPKYHFGTGKR